MVVALEGYLLDLDLLLAVYLECDADRILDHRITHLEHIHFRVDESFLLEIVLDDVDRRAEHVVRQRDSPAEAQAVLKLALLGILDALEVPSGYPDRVYPQPYLGEMPLSPDSADYRRSLLARNSQLHAFPESGERDYLLLSEILYALDADSAQDVFAWMLIIYCHTGCVLLSFRNVSGGRRSRQELDGIPVCENRAKEYW